MLESNIVAGILRYLRSLPDCFCWKEHGGMYGTAGIPDIIVCLAGRFLAFEVKQPGKVPTKIQEITLARISAAQGVARIVTSVQEVKDIIQQLQEGLPHG